MGSCLTLGKELSEETHADKAEDFLGKGHLGRELQGKGTQSCSATWLTVPGFIAMGLVSGLSPFDLSQILQVGCGLLVLCSFLGPPVLKQLLQTVTGKPGQDGQFQSMFFPQQLHCSR